MAALLAISGTDGIDDCGTLAAVRLALDCPFQANVFRVTS
jgi:hypothetical protein